MPHLSPLALPTLLTPDPLYQTPLAFGLTPKSRHGDDFGPRSTFQQLHVPDLLCDLVAVHLGHVDVKQDYSQQWTSQVGRA